MSPNTQALRKWIARQPRTPQWLRATVRRSDGGCVSATVTNVSDGGCRLRFSDALSDGDLVTIQVGSFAAVPARICWAVDGAAGAQFLAHATAVGRFAA
jgi:hypothetical protein